MFIQIGETRINMELVTHYRGYPVNPNDPEHNDKSVIVFCGVYGRVIHKEEFSNYISYKVVMEKLDNIVEPIKLM